MAGSPPTSTERAPRVFVVLLLLFLSGTIHPGCQEAGVGTAYVWRLGGLVLRETPRIAAERIVKIDFGQRVQLLKIDPTGEAALLDGVRGRWIEVRVNGRVGFLFEGFLARLEPPRSCESFANYLADLDRRVDHEAAPETESIPLRVATGTGSPIPASKRRTTTRYENGVSVIDEESPRFASIAITIEEFPLPAAFQLAKFCNENFFQTLIFPRKPLRRARPTETGRSVDTARFSPSGVPMFLENKTETDAHIEKTTLQPAGKGAVRIKYYYGSLEARTDSPLEAEEP